MGMLNDELKMYRIAQSKQLGFSQWYQIPVWNDLIGFIGGVDDFGHPKSVPFGASKEKKLKPTGKVIEVLADYYHEGSWEMEIPLMLPFREKPVVGDDQAKGKEESRAWVYNKAYITQVRKPAKISDGAMGDLAINKNYLKQMWSTLRREFQDFNQRLQAISPYDALYRGYDDQLIRSKELPNCVQKSHPNFFVEGYGRVPFNPNNAAYETAIVSALQNLGSADKFSMKTLRKMQMAGSELMFVPTTAGNYPVKGIAIINDKQMAQLVEDPLFRENHIALTTATGEKSPLFTGVYEAHLIEGVLLLVDINNYGVWIPGDTNYNSSRGIINYGNENPLKNPIHISDIKLALYVSASAVLCGTTKQLQFKQETDDYDNVRSEASVTVVGYNRADRFDFDKFLSTNESVTNTSSLVVATRSPHNLSWSNPSS